MKQTSSLLLLLFIPVAVLSQNTTGNLEGWIFDANGDAIVGATVSVTSPDLQGIRGTSTSSSGYFRLMAVPPGVYMAKVSHMAYVSATITGIRVPLGVCPSIGFCSILA